MQRSATFSKCGRYRYALTRRWDTGRAVTWIMLNPSTADATQDDATVRRVTAYSRAWGFGALTVVNLYAFRATDPGDLFRSADPIGPDNDRHIAQAASGRDLILAWGAHARPERIAAVTPLLTAAPGAGRTHALALTAAGQPKHPLYLPARLTPVPCHPVADRAGSRRPPCRFDLAAPSHTVEAGPC